jgi:hypothetical protein
VEELSGWRMLVMRSLGLAIVVAVSSGLLVSCRDPRPAVPRAAADASDPVAHARDAVKRGDHAAAVTLLRDVIHSRPDVLEAHYLLAVSQSYLDQADEAGREFEWVVAHGERGSAEVAIAREWLASRATPSTSAPPAAPPGADEAPAQRPELASLSGRAFDRPGPKARLLLFLRGLPGSPVQGEAHNLRTDSRGHFVFQNVAPGDYVLTDAVAGPATWRLSISLARGERRVLDLSPSNSTSVRDDAAERPR